MHTTMVLEQVKTMKIQAGIQVSRPRELTRQLQLWKRFGRLYLIVFVLVRNITAGPTKMRVGERQRAEDEPKLLDTTVGRVVPLLPIAPARAKSELDASVDKLFDEGGSGNLAEQGDSTSGGHGVGIPRVSQAAKTILEDVAPVQPRHQRKRKIVVPDAGGPSHPPKKLREDHGTPSGASVGGKSRSAVQRLLVGAMQNAEVRGEPIPTLPFITSSVSATQEREDEVHTDSATELNLRTIGAPQRFVISSDSSHHSGANIAKAKVDSFTRPFVPLMTVATIVTSTVDPAITVKEKFVESFVFGGDSFGGRAYHTVGGFSDHTGSDFIVGGIRTVISPDTDLQKVYVPQWSVTNGTRLDDGRTCREMVDEFAPPKFFASIRGMEHDQLFTKFNVWDARQMSLSAEVWMRAEYNIRERRRLRKNSLLKAMDVEIESLKAQLLVKEAKATEAIHLCTEASKFEVWPILLLQLRLGSKKLPTWMLKLPLLSLRVTTLRVHELETSSAGLQEKVTTYENFIDQLKKFQDEKMKEVNEKFDKLCTDFVEMALHLEDKFYMRLLTTISGPTIGKAVEKGTQEGLSVRITHGAKGRKLTDVAAYNPSAEVDYLSALQRLQSVNFTLITELKANKDASIDTIMNLLRLEDTLAERLGLTESQPHVNQLMVPIHHSPDQHVVGASDFSLSLDVSSSRVWKIKKNIANHVSALRDVFIPLSEPLSAVALEGTEGTSVAAVDTTTALSIVVASTSTVRSISVDDYEVTGTDDQATADSYVADEDANPFTNVNDAELNVPE
ncbi:hypothetical protein Tco_0077289 [Tanacetum coccineum]